MQVYIFFVQRVMQDGSGNRVRDLKIGEAQKNWDQGFEY